MKLIVGLGNPGDEYVGTRHNVGFFVVDQYLRKKNITSEKCKFNGLYSEYIINGDKAIFLKPQSYMNLSGEVVRKFVNYYKIDLNDILIISDDLDLSVGNYKLKASGSSGGHNGLKNIEVNLSTDKFKRLKIGISRKTGNVIKDYVLGKISADDQVIYDQKLEEFIRIIDDFFIMDFDKLMNKYNRKNR